MKRTIDYHTYNMTNKENIIKEFCVVVNKLFSETEETTISLEDINCFIHFEPLDYEYGIVSLTKINNEIRIYLDYEDGEDFPEGVYVTPDEIDWANLKYLTSELTSWLFTPCAGKCECNYGGMEVEINKSNDAARFRRNWGDDCLSKVTEWCEIEYNEEGDPFCKLPNGDIENLNEYMRFNL